MSGTSLFLHMLGYVGGETLGTRFRDAVRVHGYDVDEVNEMIRELNDAYYMMIPEVVA